MATRARSLILLRAYFEDPAFGPNVAGSYRLEGRMGHDLWLIPLHIAMEYGPRWRPLTVAADELILGSVGESWPEARYRRVR